MFWGASSQLPPLGFYFPKIKIIFSCFTGKTGRVNHKWYDFTNPWKLKRTSIKKKKSKSKLKLSWILNSQRLTGNSVFLIYLVSQWNCAQSCILGVCQEKKKGEVIDSWHLSVGCSQTLQKWTINHFLCNSIVICPTGGCGNGSALWTHEHIGVEKTRESLRVQVRFL